MQYQCVHCDKPFEVAQGERPRCPKCMRLHAVERTTPEGTGSAPRSKTRAGHRLAVAGLVLVGLLGISVSWYLQPRAGRLAGGSERAPAPEELGKELHARGVQLGELATLLAPSPAIEQLAHHAAAAKGSVERARAIVRAIGERGRADAFVPWSLATARREPGPWTAAQVAKALAADGARKQLYPLELSLLAVAALRSLGEQAQVAEIFAFPGERTPPDPSGRLGYYGLAVPAANGTGHTYFDPYGQRDTSPAASEVTLLSERELLAAALAIRASHALARAPTTALRDADAAVWLAPRSATVRGARAVVLLGNAGSDEAERELAAARELRPDAPRRHNLALVKLASGAADEAGKELGLALEQSPDFASALVTLAALKLGHGERAEALEQLARAQALAPDLPSLPLVRAQYHQAMGELPEALAQAERGVQLDPDNPQPRLLLAQLYAATGRKDAMREQANHALGLMPPDQRARMQTLLAQMLGPEALEPSAGGPEPPATGSQADDPTDPSLTGSLKDPSPLPKLRLREPGTKLDLSD